MCRFVDQHPQSLTIATEFNQEPSMILQTRRTVLAAWIAVSIAACGGKDAATDPLAYVPADTPYVLANQTATPKGVAQAWMKMYGVSVEQMYADMAKDPNLQAVEGEFGEWLRAALPEVGKMASIDGMEQLGMKAEARFAMYGYGLMPVYRIELGDAAKFAATIARIEERAGKKLGKRKLGDADLWQFGDDKAQVLFGPIGNFLVITLAPTKADDDRLKAQLGLTLPASSLASSGGLAALDKQQGYDGHLSGYMDIRALAHRMSGRNQDDNQVISAFGGEVPKLSESCQAELDGMTQKFPRVVFGTTRLDQKQMRVSSLFEMEPELAKSLQKLAAPIPGSDSKDAMMLRVALSVDLPEAVRFLNGVADSIATKPYQCEELKNLNDSAAELKQGLANPGLAMAGAMSAMHFGLQNFAMEPGAQMPSAFSGFLTMGSSSPVMLWGFAQQGVPALAQIPLTTDGKIVALPADAVPMPLPIEFKAVMTEKSLGIATTDVADATFSAAAAMPAANDGTILRYGFSGAFFKLLADNIPAPAADADPQQAKDAERGREMVKAMGENIDQMDVRIRLTAGGIEMVQEGSLK
jgi:hypothetical protein